MESQSASQHERHRELEADNLEWGELRDWAQLVRLPNVFTLFSDCIVAAIVATGRLGPLTATIPIVFASLCAYWAGMILNDVVDIDEDRQLRPDRPLASGRISQVIAGHVATGMLLIGPILILAAMTFHQSQPLWLGFAFLSSVLLSLAVRSYDSPVKRTPLGPPLMGICRSLNILMVGFSMLALTQAGGVASELAPDAAVANAIDVLIVDPLLSQSSGAGGSVEGQSAIRLPDVIFPKPLLGLALGIGLYIFGVTVYARREEQESSAAGLSLGILLELAGLVVIGLLPSFAETHQAWTLNPRQGYPLLITLIGLTVANRGIAGVMHPVPRKVQLAVKHAILTLILIDAAVVLMWAGAWYGCAVVALLLPALSSAMRFRST